MDSHKLTHAHFQAKATSAQFKAAIASGYFDWLRGLLDKVVALGPDGITLAQKTIHDVEAGDWFSVAMDAMHLVQMLQASEPTNVPA